ncbi:hypothetical protein [Clostridium sp. FP1]|uniref:hypothetical protein n=1 Tax=Clostridium sp. FP1 TaxID=2724076 RepID=UPI0013E986DB|nr:hypothetical protein [Clostridium sp. FP1]MBZ9637707.1 hypothetical protein [Clostridium sp. FP1]
MKIMCKCGNIEDIKTDNKTVDFEFKDCDDGTIFLVCKKCNEVIFIKLYIKSYIHFLIKALIYMCC